MLYKTNRNLYSYPPKTPTTLAEYQNIIIKNINEFPFNK